MGLARGAIALMLEEAHARPFHGKIATLGRQTIYTTAAEIGQQFVKFQVKPNGTIPPDMKDIQDTDVFGWMGCESVTSLDYSDFEGASRIVDLNKDSIPEDLVGAFDIVLDSGTLEHVFHLPNAMKNTLSLLNIGGRIIFLSPSSNHLDHGFYMFSPTLFADYFAANGFRIETLYVVRYSGDLQEMWDAYSYQPGQWRDMHIGGLDDRPYAIWVVATRLEQSTIDVIPQQGYYADKNPAYAGSRLATGAIGKTEDVAIAPTTARPSVPSSVPHITAQSLIRKFARQVPGARRIWRLIRNPLHTKGITNVAPTHQIFRKKIVGKF